MKFYCKNVIEYILFEIVEILDFDNVIFKMLFLILKRSKLREL